MTGKTSVGRGRGVLTITSGPAFQDFGPTGFTGGKEGRLFDERPAPARSFGGTILDIIGGLVEKAGERAGRAVDDAIGGFASARAPARTGARIIKFPSGYPAIEISEPQLEVYRDVFAGGGRIPVKHVPQHTLRELTGRDEEVYGAAHGGVIYIDRTLAERHGPGEVEATKAHEASHVLYPRSHEGPVELAGYVVSRELAQDGDPTVSYRARLARDALERRYGGGIADLADQISWRVAA